MNDREKATEAAMLRVRCLMDAYYDVLGFVPRPEGFEPDEGGKLGQPRKWTEALLARVLAPEVARLGERYMQTLTQAARDTVEACEAAAGTAGRSEGLGDVAKAHAEGRAATYGCTPPTDEAEQLASKIATGSVRVPDELFNDFKHCRTKGGTWPNGKPKFAWDKEALARMPIEQLRSVGR